jgi:hypothetical protein
LIQICPIGTGQIDAGTVVVDGEAEGTHGRGPSHSDPGGAVGYRRRRGARRDRRTACAADPQNNSFPGEVLLELAADAIEESGASREQPLEFEGIRKRHLPEDRAHTKAQHHKAEYALRAAAMVRAGVDPGLLDEVRWWRTDDLWFWALEALVTYVRAAAEHGGELVSAVCGRIARRHDVQLAATT